MLLAVVGIVLYNLAQKLQPTTTNPFLILTITYLVAAGFSIVLYRLVPGGDTDVSAIFIPAACLGGAVVVAELGFLLIYRSGWNISIASVVSTVAAAIFLLPVGAIFLQEKLSQANIVGILLCLVGLFLAIQK